MSDFQYKSAPITEAVVEFRSPTKFDEKKRLKGINKLNKLYASHNQTPMQTYTLEVTPQGEHKSKVTNKFLQDKFLSEDVTQQLLITDVSFAVSQLAPYSGWGDFIQRIARDWNIWKKELGHQSVVRLGMRYINRIDIPIIDSEAQHEEYIIIYPNLPKLLNPTLRYSMNVNVALNDIECILNLNSAVIESPIPKHIAILVDLDISKVFNSEIKDEELFDLANKMRIKKNEIFEACITDKARELFQK